MRKEKFRKVAKEISALIDREFYPLGAQLPTEKEIAANFKVSLVTANKALSLLASDGIIKKRRGCGNFVLKKSSSRMVTFLLPSNYQNPIWNNIYEVFEGRMQKEYIVVRKMFITPEFSFKALRPENCAAIVATYLPKDLLLEIRSQNIPILHLDDCPEAAGDFLVCFNNFLSGQMAAKHLIDKGRNSLLYADFLPNLQPDYYPTLRRYAGFASMTKQLIADKGGALLHYSCIGDFKQIPDEVAILINAYAIDGILCFSDNISPYIYKAVEKAKKEIGKEISVIGIDGDPVGEFLNPPLSSLRQPIIDIGNSAADMVLTLIAGNSPPKKEIMHPPLLIERSSVR